MSQYHNPGRFNFLPTVVKNILIINGLFFLATIVLASNFNIDLIRIFGLHYFPAEDFRPYQLITYMFMHGGMTHIFFNLFAVWMFGSALENYMGPKRFMIYYLITGLGAALTHYTVVHFQLQPVLGFIDGFLKNPDLNALQGFLQSDSFVIPSYEFRAITTAFIEKYNNLISVGDMTAALDLSIQYMSDYRIAYINAPVVVGASGSVFGILLAFGMLFPNSLIYMFFLIPIKAKYFVILYGILELYAGVANTPGDNIAHFAHLGGMIFGIIMLLYWKRFK